MECMFTVMSMVRSRLKKEALMKSWRSLQPRAACHHHQGGLAAQGQANHGALRQEEQALDLHLSQHHDCHGVTEAMVKNYSAFMEATPTCILSVR